MGGQARRGVLAAAAAIAAATAQPAAADAGLAAAFNQSGTTIIVPIRTDSWLIEPQLAFTDQKVGDQTLKATSPGIGVYYRRQVGQTFEAYYGGMVACVDAGLQYTNGKEKQTGQADQDIRVWDTVVRIVARVFFW